MANTTTAPTATAFAERKAPATLVVSVVCVRLVIEILLGSFTKAVYKLQGNPAINLVLGNFWMLALCILFHLINKVVPFLPAVFGGTWRAPNFKAITGLLLPTFCLCGSIVLKQNIIKSSGPGYAEIISAIGVPISAVMQYFLNGVTIGHLGVSSCVVAAGCFCSVIPVCSTVELGGGLVAATLNVTRASLTKRSNKEFKLSPALNLVYTCVLGLPFYIVMALIGEYYLFEYNPDYNWRRLFVNYGPVTFLHKDLMIQLTLAFLSNIVVFILYDIASPLTYIIAAGLKGILQTFFDIFYIDYFIAQAVQKMGVDIDIEKYKNTKKLTAYGFAGFGLKCLYFILYVTEKILSKIAMKKQDAVVEMEINGEEEVAYFSEE